MIDNNFVNDFQIDINDYMNKNQNYDLKTKNSQFEK